MKNYFIFIIMLFLCLSANAQIRVESNGAVHVGTFKENNDLHQVTNLQILGKYGDSRSGSKASFGDMGRQANQGWNVFLGEWTTDDTDMLWLHGKYGTYFTFGDAIDKTFAYYDLLKGNQFVFNTSVTATSFNLPSDERLKENIKEIKQPLSSLIKLNGVDYNYKSKPSKLKTKSTDGSLTAKEIKDIAFFDKWDKEQKKKAIKKRHGFVAQELQEVFPELVEEQDGYLSVDYIGLIPVIVEGIKEMQSLITQQNEKIKSLETLLGKSDNLNLQTQGSTTGNEEIEITNVIPLNQNTPNPFNSSTEIVYCLPAGAENAVMNIYNINGTLIKRISLDNSLVSGSVKISSSEVPKGVLVYTLTANGKIIDQKRMINQ